MPTVSPSRITKLTDLTPYRLAAVDLDQTLLSPRMKISRPNRAAVRSLVRLGMIVVPCTGRIYHQTEPYHRSLRLQGPIISSDGAHVSIPGGPTIQEIFLDLQTAAIIRTLAKKFDVSAATHTREGVFATRQSFWNTAADRHRLNLGSAFRYAQPEELTNTPSYKVTCIADERTLNAFGDAVTKACGVNVYASRHGSELLELTAGLVDKTTGLLAVARHYSIDMSEIIAFGDGVNDATMLKMVGLGLAMNHGCIAAKTAADLVSPITDPATNFAAAVSSLLKIFAAYNRTANHPTAA